MKRSYYLVILIFLIFFAISFLTNILGSINPNVSDSFTLSGTMTGLLPFSFFIAYALMSIPSGMIVQKYDEKRSLVFAWVLAFTGALIFSLFPSFPVFLGSLFLIGCGMALLQVALFPLLRVAGGEEHFAFNTVMVQLVFGVASFLSPFVYSWLVTHLSNPQLKEGFIIGIFSYLTPDNLPWVSIYWVFALISFLMMVIIFLSRFPRVVRKEDEVVGAWDTHVELFRMKTVILFFIGIFAYVGVEQGIANWISEFLRSYHNLKPEAEGAATVGLFWGMMTVGCVLGLVLVRILDSKIVLRIFTIATLIVLSLTLFGNKQMAVHRFPCPRILYIRYVCPHFFPCSQQHFKISWIFCRYPLYSNCRGRIFLPADRKTERYDRITGRHADIIFTFILYTDNKFLGETNCPECNCNKKTKVLT